MDSESNSSNSLKEKENLNKSEDDIENLKSKDEIVDNNKLDKNLEDESENIDSGEWSKLVDKIDNQLSADEINKILKDGKKKILQDNLRPKLWKVFLNVNEEKIHLHEIFDLPDQKSIRKQCQNFVQKLNLDEVEKLKIQSDLELIITSLCKNYKIDYDLNNGWLDILSALLPLKYDKFDLYKVFEKIILVYVLKYWDKNENKETVLNNQQFCLFRLLLLYFDPELCSFLDTMKITPDMYATTWFRSLFASHFNIKIIQSVWDIYFQWAEPMMIFYISLLMLINCKDQLFEMKDKSKDEIITFINTIPNNFEYDDIEDLYELIETYYITHTPKSINDLSHLLFLSIKENADKDELISSMYSKLTDLSQILCLPLSVKSIIPSACTLPQFRFFVVDCRPAEQYNNGHLSTAFHLDCSLMLQEPNAFNTAIQALLASQQQAIEVGSLAGGKHLCFLGSGREEEDRYLNMVVASFLQKKRRYVSIAFGGFEQLHIFLSENNLMDLFLIEHNRRYCLPCSKYDSIRSLSNLESCQKNNNISTKLISSSSSIFNFSNPIANTFNSLNKNISVINKDKNSDCNINKEETNNESLLEKMASTFKNKSQIMKEKFNDILLNPINSNSSGLKRHVSASDLGKRYNPRNFSIADDEICDDNDQENKNDLEIDVEAWCKQNKAISKFKCKELKEKNKDQDIFYSSYLVLTERNLFILREIRHNKGYAKIVAKRPLERLLQITSKRKTPELITFRYGQMVDKDEANHVMISDQLLIHNQNEVIKIIKQQIAQIIS